jgi:hypothetical protein
MLHMLGSTQIGIERTPDTGPVHGFAAKDSTGGVQVLLYNQVNNYPNCTNPVSGSDQINLTMTNLGNQALIYRCYAVDQTHSNAFQAWKSMGSPPLANISGAQWSTLRSSMALAVVDSNSTPEKIGPTFSKSYTLAKEGVMLITLTPDPKLRNQSRMAGRLNEPGVRMLSVTAQTLSLAFSGPLPGTADVNIQIINCRGQIVRTNGTRQGSTPGESHAITIDLRDGRGAALPAGVYLCKVKAGLYILTASFCVY